MLSGQRGAPGAAGIRRDVGDLRGLLRATGLVGCVYGKLLGGNI